jgi:hypothetical protein
MNFNSRRSGILSLLLVGGYYAWRNRERIGSFLSNTDFKDRFGNVVDRVRSSIPSSVSDRLSNMTSGISDSISSSGSSSNTMESGSQGTRSTRRAV